MVFAPAKPRWDMKNERNPQNKGNESRNSFDWSPYSSSRGRFFQQKIKPAIFSLISAIHKPLNGVVWEGDFKTLIEALRASIDLHIRHENERLRPPMYQVADILVYYCRYPEKVTELAKNKIFKKSVNFAHWGMLKYNENAFVYADQRLVYISELLKSLIKHYYNNDAYLLKAADCVVFLMKEDIRWRRTFIQILQELKPVLESLSLERKNISETLVCLEILCKQCSLFEFTPEEVANMEWDA